MILETLFSRSHIASLVDGHHAIDVLRDGGPYFFDVGAYSILQKKIAGQTDCMLALAVTRLEVAA